MKIKKYINQTYSFMKPSALIIPLIIFSIALNAQPNLSKIKKKIPVENVLSVKESPFGSSIYYYVAKNDSGLWNAKSKKLIVSHLKNVWQPTFTKNIILYHNQTGYGMYYLDKRKTGLTSSHPIHLVLSQHKNVAIIINKDYLGYYDFNLQTAYYLNPSMQKEDTVLLQATKKTVFFCEFDAINKSMAYIDVDYGGEDYDNISKSQNLLAYSGNHYSLQSGEQVFNDQGFVKDMDSLILFTNQNSINYYYSPDLTLLAKGVSYSNFTTEHFQKLVDTAITNVTYLGNWDTYLCNRKGSGQFYSSSNLQPISPIYDYVFPIGNNHTYKGFSFFTFNKNKGFGLYNLKKKEVLKPNYNVVEEIMDTNGNRWLKADDQIFAISDKDAVGDSWNLSKETIIINHISIHENKLIISTRSTSEDTHDSQHYTASEFDDGSGVIDLEDSVWLIKPIYHTFTPFKNHYVAMQGGQYSYHNSSHIATLFFDKNFKAIPSPKLGYSFIFNDIVLARKGTELIEYDVPQNKIIRTLGTINGFAADFTLKNGYLVLGDNNYINNHFTSKYIRQLYLRETEGSINAGALYLNAFNYYNNNDYKSMDILDIINPEGQLIKVPLKRFTYVEIYDHDLVVIGRIKEGEPKDRPVYELDTDGEAIFDLRTQKFITPWFRVIGLTKADTTFHLWDFDSSKGEIKVVLDDIRKKEWVK